MVRLVPPRPSPPRLDPWVCLPKRCASMGEKRVAGCGVRPPPAPGRNGGYTYYIVQQGADTRMRGVWKEQSHGGALVEALGRWSVMRDKAGED